MIRQYIQEATALLVVISFLITAAQAQRNDGVIVQGNPPLTLLMVDEMIDFFQWSLGGSFTDRQREDFKNGMISDWRKGNPEDIETALKILELRNQIATLTEDKRAEIQSEVQTELLKSLYQQPNDPTAKLLLEVYEVGRRLNTRNGGTIDTQIQTNNAPFNTTATARGLIGEWSSGNTSAIDYVNPNTGTRSAPSGNQIGIKFLPDGTYIEAALLQSSMYNCTMTVFFYKTGIYQVEGATLYLEEKTSYMKSQENCRREGNYEKNPPVQKYVYKWQIAQDTYGLKLLLVGTKGDKYAYNKVTSGNERLGR